MKRTVKMMSGFPEKRTLRAGFEWEQCVSEIKKTLCGAWGGEMGTVASEVVDRAGYHGGQPGPVRTENETVPQAQPARGVGEQGVETPTEVSHWFSGQGLPLEGVHSLALLA